MSHSKLLNYIIIHLKVFEDGKVLVKRHVIDDEFYEKVCVPKIKMDIYNYQLYHKGKSKIL